MIKYIQKKIKGTKENRLKFKELLSFLKEEDTLVVTKLDRFARSTSDAIETVKQLFDKGVKVHALNMDLVENTSTGRLIFSVISAFSEFERDMIVESTQKGKDIAKQRPDFRKGRPNKFSKRQIEHALELLENNSYNRRND